jgi:hypothetical protein
MSGEIFPLKWRAMTRPLPLKSTNEGRREVRTPTHQ